MFLLWRELISIFLLNMTFCPFHSVAQDEVVQTEISCRLELGRLKEFSSLDALEIALGDKPILNKTAASSQCQRVQGQETSDSRHVRLFGQGGGNEGTEGIAPAPS